MLRVNSLAQTAGPALHLATEADPQATIGASYGFDERGAKRVFVPEVGQGGDMPGG